MSSFHPDLVQLAVLVVENHHILFYLLQLGLHGDFLQLELLSGSFLLIQLLLQIL